MRKTMMAMVVLTIAMLAAASMAVADDAAKTDVLTTVNRFVDAFNKGDGKTAEALMIPDAPIIDEVPPYVWKGAGSFQAWMSAYAAEAEKNGITDGHVTLGKPKHVMMSGEHAYVVIPSNYAYKEKGKPVKQTGSMFTLTLQKQPSGWLIAGWSWSTN